MDNIDFTDNSLQATLLLSCFFNKIEAQNYNPLTPSEYGTFASWLHENKFTPADLLQRKNEVLKLWHDPQGHVSNERIEGLLSRGVSMGFALEKWSNAGIWVMSRADSSYPIVLKNKLKALSPPVLFGTGNKELLNSTGIGFVGSRNIDNDDESFTKAKAQLAIKQGFTVVSGGAKGVGQTAMQTALKAGGCCIGLLADSLFRSSVSKGYREYILDNRLVLVSTFYPEAGFNTSNALACNKYIYSLSKTVVIVKSGLNKGRTWNGAKENIRNRLAVTLIRDINNPGNKELIKLGGKAIDDSFSEFTQEHNVYRNDQQPSLNEKKWKSTGQLSLFSYPSKVCHSTEELLSKDEEPTKTNQSNTDNVTIEPSSVALEVCGTLPEYGSLLKLFYQDIRQHCQDKKQITMQDLKKIYPELTARGISKWLGILTEKKLLVRVGKKHSYRLF